MAALRYAPLDKSKKTIRLLHVFPGEPDDLVRCKLEHVDLDDRPSYVALSYTWDQAGGHDELELCGVKTRVGRNLSNSLHRFRDVDKSCGTRLWIDALCKYNKCYFRIDIPIPILGINQKDACERNHQVGHMCAIYSTAASVIAWLGESSSNSHLAFTVVSARRHCGRYNTAETREALSDLLNRRYWARIWVIQEFLLPRHLDIWWGELRTKAETFYQVIRDMAYIYSSPEERPLIWETPGRILLGYRDNCQRMCAPGNTFTSEFRQMLQLGPLLTVFSNSQCTLLHDKIYALLGIAIDVVHSPYPVTPDYSKSCQALLVDVLRSVCGNSLDAAGEAGELIGCLRSLPGVRGSALETYAFQQSTEIERQIHIVMSIFQTSKTFD